MRAAEQLFAQIVIANSRVGFLDHRLPQYVACSVYRSALFQAPSV